MMESRRLNNKQIVIMRRLIQHGATMRGIVLPQWMRRSTIHLWRKGFVEIWYRQMPREIPGISGPFYRLTDIGARLAVKFFPAPRGISGAQERQ
jgi:hypothetical protein